MTTVESKGPSVAVTFCEKKNDKPRISLVILSNAMVKCGLQKFVVAPQAGMTSIVLGAQSDSYFMQLDISKDSTMNNDHKSFEGKTVLS